MSLTRTVCLATAVSLSTTSYAAADGFVAVMLGENQMFGKGIGATKNAAIANAEQDCEKVTGNDCGYYYWTRSTSYLVFMYCEFDVGGEEIRGGLAHHSTRSLARAKELALNDLKRDLLRNTYDYLREEDCRVLVTYSPGGVWQG